MFNSSNREEKHHSDGDGGDILDKLHGQKIIETNKCEWLAINVLIETLNVPPLCCNVVL